MERFWSKVEKGPHCWTWKNGKNKQGYGAFKYEGKMRGAHRVAYFLTFGEWPKLLRHSCDNPPCVNPAHLTPGTVRDNAMDAKARRRLATGERHGKAVLTAARVRAIRADAESGMTQRKIAGLYGIAQTTVSQIVRGATWTEG